MTGSFRMARQVLVAVALLLVTCASAIAQSTDVTTVELQVGDNMRYVPAVVEATPGEQLRVVLKASGKIAALAHNFVLLKKGVGPKRFVDKASTATKETGSIPPAIADQVIAMTALAKSGETAQVTFQAPMQPGEYTFVCSFPGHYNLGMKGQFVVK